MSHPGQQQLGLDAMVHILVEGHHIVLKFGIINREILIRYKVCPIYPLFISAWLTH